MKKIELYKSFQELKKDSEKKHVEKSPPQSTWDDEFKDFIRILKESKVSHNEALK